MVPDGPIKTCQIWLPVIDRFNPKKVVKIIPKIIIDSPSGDEGATPWDWLTVGNNSKSILCL